MNFLINSVYLKKEYNLKDLTFLKLLQDFE